MIVIDELLIRMPGLTPEQGMRLGKQVGQLVGQQFPEGLRSMTLSRLNVKLTGLQAQDSRLAEMIAARIIEQIKIELG